MLFGYPIAHWVYDAIFLLAQATLAGQIYLNLIFRKNAQACVQMSFCKTWYQRVTSKIQIVDTLQLFKMPANSGITADPPQLNRTLLIFNTFQDSAIELISKPPLAPPMTRIANAALDAQI